MESRVLDSPGTLFYDPTFVTQERVYVVIAKFCSKNLKVAPHIYAIAKQDGFVSGVKILWTHR